MGDRLLQGMRRQILFVPLFAGGLHHVIRLGFDAVRRIGVFGSKPLVPAGYGAVLGIIGRLQSLFALVGNEKPIKIQQGELVGTDHWHRRGGSGYSQHHRWLPARGR